LLSRPSIDKYAVVCEHPTEIEDATRKQWEKSILRLASHHEDTAAQLGSRISLMQSVTFASSPPADLLEVDMLFATQGEFEQAPPECDVLVIIGSVQEARLDKIRSKMGEGGRVVVYI
jgi:hypothetical protein